MRQNTDGGKFTLLHIDDCADDRLLLREAISLTNTPFTLCEAESADAAVPYFRFPNEGSEKQYPRPALVLLDYSMGRQSGADFLYWLRITNRITLIPVVMYSGTEGEKCIEDCYAQGANYFLRKPNDLVRLKVIISTLYLFLGRGDEDLVTGLQEYKKRPCENGS